MRRTLIPTATLIVGLALGAVGLSRSGADPDNIIHYTWRTGDSVSARATARCMTTSVYRDIANLRNDNGTVRNPRVGEEVHERSNCSTPPTTTTTTLPASTTTTVPASTTTTTQPPNQGCTNPDVFGTGEARGYPDPTGDPREYLIHNNEWNDTTGGTATVTSCDYDDWYADARYPNPGDLGVQTYINVHRDYNDAAISGITSSEFGHNMPRVSGDRWNVAYDIWIGSNFSHELMIWTEYLNQTPAGSQVGTVTIGGQQYQVWRAGSGDGGILTYRSVNTQTSGVMPLSAFFADARSRGWTVNTTWQVDYGIEIVGTQNQVRRFTVNRFSITDA